MTSDDTPTTAEQFAAFFNAALPARPTLADLTPEAGDDTEEDQ